VLKISNGKMIMNYELGRMWKEEVVAYFNVLSQKLTIKIRKTTTML
jgi:hypothetical protein